MGDVVAQLAKFVERIDAEQVHFVGHSLGGLVLYRYFETAPCAQPGRVVFLGSPTVKSRTAERVGPPAAAVVADRPPGHPTSWSRPRNCANGAARASWD